MLKIQLCPPVELENKHWWVVDVAAVVLLTTAAWLSSDLLLNQMTDEIIEVQRSSQKIEAEYASLKPTVDKFNGLQKEIDLLNKKVEILKRITLRQSDKIKPVVVLDQMQTLIPEGLWLTSLSLDENKTVKIKGASRDSLLISEFLLGLRESMNPDTWTNDIRTKIGYQDIGVKEVVRVKKDGDFQDLVDFLAFDVTAVVADKERPILQEVSMVPKPRSKTAALFR